MEYHELEKRDRAARARSLSKPYEFCIRCDLPLAHDWFDRALQRFGYQFVRDLVDFDPLLNLIWSPQIGRWLLYRMTQGTGRSSQDRLRYQFTIEGPNGEYREPGDWLIRDLKQRDRWHKYQLTEREMAKAYMAEQDRLVAEWESEQEKELDTIAEQMATDMAEHISERAVVQQPGLSL